MKKKIKWILLFLFLVLIVAGTYFIVKQYPKYEKTKQDQEKQIAKLTELNLIYEQFNKYLNQNSLYDFNDMINFVLDAFEKNNDLKIHYAEKFQFIMLDEYQDTNNAQNKIIDLILSVSSPLSTETL